MGLFDILSNPQSTQFGSALQRLGQQDTAYRDDQHMQKVFAANPNYALKLYGAKNQQQDNETNRLLSLAKLQNIAQGGDQPSALKELAAFDKMTPEQKQTYWNIKRNQWQNAGGMLINPQTGEQIQKTVSPDQQPALKGAQANAINEADLIGKPLITEANAAAEIRGKGDITPKEAKLKGQQQVSNILSDISNTYDQLDAAGGVTNTQKSIGDNISAYLGNTDTGQAIGKATGTETQSLRNKIAQTRPALINAIRQSTGMSAKAMNSNAELQFYLQQATDPKLDIQANKAAIQRLEQFYGLGANSPSPATASPSGIPEDAVLIGSQGGKPVYKLPDGRGWTP